MNHFVQFRRILLIFLVLAVILPISSIILFITGGVFASFGEDWSVAFFRRAAGLVGIVWTMDVVFLLLWLAWDRFLTQEGA